MGAFSLVQSVPMPMPEALEELGACLLGPLEAEWAKVMACGDVDAAWGYWTWAAEEVLLALSLPQLAPADIDGRTPLPVAPATLCRGRGTRALVRETPLCPRQQKHGGAPETLPLARIHAAQGALRTVLRWLHRPDPRPGAAPREVLCAWGAARKRLRKVREMGPAFAALPPLEAHEPLPGEESLHRATEALRGMAKVQRAREDHPSSTHPAPAPRASSCAASCTAVPLSGVADAWAPSGCAAHMPGGMPPGRAPARAHTSD